MTDRNPNTPAPLAPACGPTMERLQLVLDGELPAAALDTDPHPVLCSACLARIAAARLMQSALAAPAEVSVPSGLTDSILAAVRENRFTRIRRRSYAVAAGLAASLAASVLLMGWINSQSHQPPIQPLPRISLDVARDQPQPPTAPEPRPVRLGDEISRVGQALMDTSKPITEPASGAPRVLSMIAESLTPPMGPMAEFEPARTALADLPDAARTGLEPVTLTTQKAFARLLRDMGGVQVSPKPKS